MKALILAAGFGTRLEPLTLAVPKPMVLLVNKPIMQHNIELLKKYGFKDIIANIHYFPEQVENFFGDGSPFGARLSYSYEKKLLGTAGGVKRMASILGGIDKTFLVLSSDALTDINLSHLVSFHKKKKALATIALAEVSEPSHFGVVITDEEARIKAFQEKPEKGKALSNLVNSGIYVFEPEILDMIPKEKFYDFGKELFPLLVEKGEAIYGFPMVGYWSDVGSLSQYWRANIDALQGRLHIGVPGRRATKTTWLGKRVKIDKTANFEGPVLVGDRTIIERGVKIKGESVIGDKCIIEEGAEIKRSILWSDTYVGRGARIENSVIGSWCYLDDNVKVEEDCIISNRCRISKGSVILAGTRIKPGNTA